MSEIQVEIVPTVAERIAAISRVLRGWKTPSPWHLAAEGYPGVSIATDGHTAVLWDRLPNAAPCPVSGAAILVEYDPAWTAVVTFEEILAWCDGPAWPADGPCTECKGAGKFEDCDTCDGVGTCSECDRECDDCGGDGEGGSCDACEGTGRRLDVLPEARPALLSPGGPTVDLCLVRRVIEALAAHDRIEVGWGDPLGSPIRFAALDGSVVAFVMPFRAEATGAPLVAPREAA